jgi:hypothetical protein
VIRIWTRGQNLAQKSKFSKLPQNEQVRSPHCHEPNATRLGSNEHRMSEISRSVQIVKHAKNKCADCTIRTIHTDDDVAGPYDDMEEPYTDVVGLSWWTVGSLGESLVDTWNYCGEWFGATWQPMFWLFKIIIESMGIEPWTSTIDRVLWQWPPNRRTTQCFFLNI